MPIQVQKAAPTAETLAGSPDMAAPGTGARENRPSDADAPDPAPEYATMAGGAVEVCEQSPTGEERVIALGDLVIDLSVQPRSGLDEGVVQRYAEQMEAGVVLPPVQVFDDAGGQLRPYDGFHRLEAARRAGLNRVRVAVRPDDLRRRRRGGRAGERLARSPTDARERHAAVVRVLRDPARRTWADTRIAGWCGVSSHRRTVPCPATRRRPRAESLRTRDSRGHALHRQHAQHRPQATGPARATAGPRGAASHARPPDWPRIAAAAARAARASHADPASETLAGTLGEVETYLGEAGSDCYRPSPRRPTPHCIGRRRPGRDSPRRLRRRPAPSGGRQGRDAGGRERQDQRRVTSTRPPAWEAHEPTCNRLRLRREML